MAQPKTEGVLGVGGHLGDIKVEKLNDFVDYLKSEPPTNEGLPF